MIVLLIAFSVPLVPIFIFSNRRVKTMLANTANIEDLYFKKTVRKSLNLIVVVGVLYISYELYRLLSILFLNSSGSIAEHFSAFLVYGLAFCYLAYYSWGFYDRMRS